jgi:hypothetical protein
MRLNFSKNQLKKDFCKRLNRIKIFYEEMTVTGWTGLGAKFNYLYELLDPSGPWRWAERLRSSRVHRALRWHNKV